ncbi:hypothetical protein F5B22DRAFT_573223 [Xylaria bambusicola]|uniref:uncharacterized protein n=1 Tax=Xylaria bambusicola TaxID=326684 RepID=UPI002007AFF4|nr:uncharacterized protein F5B22DRAFT_573223 [Xylaria bambusicola]KAI0521439.1 hypothetical protein F5B22DRAFT_573223 [Xylaria bambusicola]
MSLLHRWSLPSRGFIRDKAQDEEHMEQTKYPTMHLSQLGPRRRANLSSVFSTLFEKPKNRRNIRRENNDSQVADNRPLLASQRENIRPDAEESGYSLEYEFQDPVATFHSAPLGQGGVPELLSKDTTADNGETSPCISPGIFIQGKPQADVKRSVRCFSLSSTVTHESDSRLEESPSTTSVEKDKVRERNLSASSSYPSEGLRSPVPGYCSPELATPHTMRYLAEYRRFGQYPSKSSWHLANLDTDETPISADHEGKTSASSSTEIVSPGCSIAGQSCNVQPLPFCNPSESHTNLRCADKTQSQRRLSILQGVRAHQKPSSTSEITVPILENEDAVSSRLEVSFMSYRRPHAKSTSDDDDNNSQDGRNTSSANHLHPSEDTERTIVTAIKRCSISDNDGTWSTIHEVRERRSSSWMMQLFSLNSPNGTALAQRLRKMKIRKWAKRACFKTKARFELVGRPVKLASPRRKWRHRLKQRTMKKVRRNFGKKKNTNKDIEGGKESKKNARSKKLWDVSETLEATKKRTRHYHRGMTNHLFDNLSKRKSLQFATMSKSGKEDRICDTHKRTRSCPADLGV